MRGTGGLVAPRGAQELITVLRDEAAHIAWHLRVRYPPSGCTIGVSLQLHVAV